ncbi:hypothetical protein OAO09_01025 [Candidatus Pelagibacter sp.]|nr:hypothetical protein [Candidatus Pelagibacter sp.]
MKTIKHEIKLEKSVKIILGAFVFGIILNAFVTPIGQELFGIKNANAAGQVHKIAICDQNGSVCTGVKKRNSGNKFLMQVNSER